MILQFLHQEMLIKFMTQRSLHGSGLSITKCGDSCVARLIKKIMAGIAPTMMQTAGGVLIS